MNISPKKTSKKFLRLFYINPKLISTILFIPFLYILGWLLAQPLNLLNVNKEDIPLIGTIFTFFIFVILLPYWFRIRWGILNTWKILGIKKSNKNQNSNFYYFLKGLLYSIILMTSILFPLIGTQYGHWLGKISTEIIINFIFLIIGVGFAEELVFRGWLLEEFKKQFGLKKALISQALIFSLVHIGFNLPFLQMLCILSGIFLLGILLALIRLNDKNSLWGCVGMHGGLVGIWFLSNNGLIEISKDAPAWIVGPGYITTNPLGGVFGIAILLVLCFIYFMRINKKILDD